MTAGQFIRGLRKAMMLSQMEFAHLVGVTITTVVGWELYGRTPRNKSWKRLIQLHETFSAQQK